MAKRIGNKTVEFQNVYIESFGAVVGKKEGEGPLGAWFDKVFNDEYAGQTTFEEAESHLQKTALEIAAKKSDFPISSLDFILAGDLLNQCIGSSFGLKNLGIPFLGLYGACSTMALSLGIGATLVDSGAANLAAAVTSSHFCSSERQFRFPLEYGSQRTPTAQWTVTGSGAAIIGKQKSNILLSKYTAGKIEDLGITDANNMGAAMAPAAYSTIKNFLEDTNTSPSSFDCIFTGDLGFIGSELLYELFKKDGINLEPYHNDCGMMMFKRKQQDVHAGGSGCGCVGSITCSYIFSLLKKGELKRIAICGTGALLSTVSTGQGKSIPAIAHLIELEHKD